MKRFYENKNFRLKISQDFNAESPREWDNLGKMVCWHRRYNLGDKHDYPDLETFWESLAAEVGLEVKVDWDEEQIKEINSKVIILPLYLYDHGGITMNTGGFNYPWDSGQVGWIYCTKEKFRKETGYMEDELFNPDPHRNPKQGEHVRIKGHENKDWGKILSIDSQQSGIQVVVDFDYNKIPSARKLDNIVTVPLTDIVEVMANRAQEMLIDEVKTYNQYLTSDVYSFTFSSKRRCGECGHVHFHTIDSASGFYGRESLLDEIKDYLGNEYAEVLESVGV